MTNSIQFTQKCWLVPNIGRTSNDCILLDTASWWQSETCRPFVSPRTPRFGLLKIRKFLGIGNGPLGLTTDCGENSLVCFYYQSKVLVNNLGPMERLQVTGTVVWEEIRTCSQDIPESSWVTSHGPDIGTGGVYRPPVNWESVWPRGTSRTYECHE